VAQDLQSLHLLLQSMISPLLLLPLPLQLPLELLQSSLRSRARLQMGGLGMHADAATCRLQFVAHHQAVSAICHGAHWKAFDVGPCLESGHALALADVGSGHHPSQPPKTFLEMLLWIAPCRRPERPTYFCSLSFLQLFAGRPCK
jgi:hypothetical protein